MVVTPEYCLSDGIRCTRKNGHRFGKIISDIFWTRKQLKKRHLAGSEQFFALPVARK
jgi:hypothetical protein